jgi:3-hydroxyacyl-CoA dehydrogenase
MIVQHSADLGITRRQISDKEIVERLVYAMVNEGPYSGRGHCAACFRYRYGLPDRLWLPLFRGGPMFYADTVGLANVLAAMAQYARGYQGSAWQPAPLLVKLAGEGKGFNS